MSLIVRFSDRFVPERRYVLEVLLGDFLGLTYEIRVEPGTEGYVIELPNGRRLRIRDAFFGQLPDSTAYLASSSLPRGTRIVSRVPFAPEADAVVLFGDGNVAQEGADLRCAIDIVATLFFMLTRWEEAIPDPSLDEHGRWCATTSLAYAGAFLHRPIVNEYVEAIWSMLEHLGCEQPRRERRFALVPTHDIDVVYHSRVRTLGFAALRARSAGALVQAARTALSAASPFDTFDWLMDMSESAELQSRFNLLGGGRSRRYDGSRYTLADRSVQAIVRNILDRGHLLGLHASYSAHLDPAQWASERQAIESAFGVTLTEGRHHYLRFRVPQTWRMWDEGGMEIDSTAGYADAEGFRCGTGDVFRTFDVWRRQALRLKERPLVIMEGTLGAYRNLSAVAAQEIFRQYIEVAARYRMPLTILFHNNSFDDVRWPGWRKTYQTIFDLSQRVARRD